MDRFGSYPAGAQKDPTGPVSGGLKVWRGAAWSYGDYPAFRRVSFRSYGQPGGRNYYVGFRLVRP